MPLSVLCFHTFGAHGVNTDSIQLSLWWKLIGSVLIGRDTGNAQFLGLRRQRAIYRDDYVYEEPFDVWSVLDVRRQACSAKGETKATIKWLNVERPPNNPFFPLKT